MSDRVDELSNHLGWEGWQLAMPASWNPVQISGSARAGRVIVADLERSRLELSWQHASSGRRVDLSRLSRGRNEKNVVWQPASRDNAGVEFTDARQARTPSGDVLTMAYSERSRRVAFVRICTTDDLGQEALAGRILATLKDAGGENPVEWCIYGFRWSVPGGMRLTAHSLAAGRARMEFRKGRRTLAFERRMIVQTEGSPDALREDQYLTVPIGHQGHRIVPMSGVKRRWWSRLREGQAWSAEWDCPVSGRRYHVEACGRDSQDLIRRAVRGVRCH